MRLNKVILNGFKSFADKTEFSFDSAITAIVGPNGCGKSNIVDAAKWVLGEQSPKSLRSGHMADVIFSGSSTRKPLGMAEVTLVVGDVRGQLAVETDEVEITRRLYKSGDSEYLINNKVCRLKDIRELFMDTGIGVRAYSIIEQGQIDQLLSASKFDRRAIFEEAAGISKYKAHKKEALRKLERTEQNLLRLADIVGEVQKQLRSIKLAAGKARNYVQYSRRLKELRVTYSLAEFHKLSSQQQKKHSVLGKAEERFAALCAEVSKNDALMSQLGDEIIRTDQEINVSDTTLVNIESKIAQNLQRIDFLRDRIVELEERKTAAAQQGKKLGEMVRQFESDLERNKEQQQFNQGRWEEKNEDANELNARLSDINSRCNTLSAELADEKAGIIDIVRRTARLHNEIQSTSAYRDNLATQKDRLSGRAEAAKSELEQMLSEKAQQQVRLGDIEKVLGELQQGLESKQLQIEETTGVIESSQRNLADKKEAKSALGREVAILADMESKREGLGNAVKNILDRRTIEKERFDYIEGIVADIIASDVKYAAAVEAAMEGKADSIVVNDSGRLLGDEEITGKLLGRVNFVCMDRLGEIETTESLQGGTRLLDVVNYDERFNNLAKMLLGNVFVVDSVEAGLERAKVSSGCRFVTLAGEVIGNDGSIAMGPVGKTAGLISRKSQLGQLENELAEISMQIGADQQKLDDDVQQRQHLSRLCKDLRTAIYEASTEKVQANSQREAISQGIERLAKEQPLIAGEMGQIAEQIAGSVQKEYESKQQLEELESVNAERNAHIESLETKLAEQKKVRDEYVGRIGDLRVELGQIAEQRKAAMQTIDALQSQIEQNNNAVAAARRDEENCQSQRTQAQRDILNSESELTEFYARKEKSQLLSDELHAKVDELLEQQKQVEKIVREKRSEQQQSNERLSEIKIELSQLEVKCEDLQQRVQEELGLDLAEEYENYSQDNIDWDQVQGEINELRGKISRLGNVNLDAIEQQEELEQRNEFLTKQVEDLDQSKAQLQQLINRLNNMSREKFRETFDQVRMNFQLIFRKLFGGGKADILLENPQDLLESEIEIVARPPGKETRSISLLSGGEKSMTALSLLFAIFKSKPSPFCFLDEVDAALDESNNERFNLIVREFQDDSQFIIITHSKRTMSISDCLFGVTMQTQGVSKKIGIKFDNYELEAEPAVA